MTTALTLDHIKFARAFLRWAVEQKPAMFTSYRECGELMADVDEAEHRILACQMHAAYETFAIADKVANRPGRQGVRRLGVWHCGKCGRYHVGLPIKRREV